MFNSKILQWKNKKIEFKFINNFLYTDSMINKTIQ